MPSRPAVGRGWGAGVLLALLLLEVTMATVRSFVPTGPGREHWPRRCALRPTKRERGGAASPTCLVTRHLSGRREGWRRSRMKITGAESLGGFPGEVFAHS